MSNTRRIFLWKGGAALAASAVMARSVFGQEPQPEPRIYVCPMHPDVQSKVPGKCQKCNMKLMATRAGGSEDFYSCPMHPDVVSNQPGNCPKCKMKLVKSAPPESSDYIVRVQTTPARVLPGKKVKFRFTILHPGTEKQVTEFNLLHEMPFHLFIISQDFSEFQHIHPDRQPDGSFTIETVLPRAGYYKIFCDFFPAGGVPQVVHRSLVTAGFRGDLVGSQARLVPEKTLVKTLEGTRFELRFDPEAPVSGKPAELHYHIVDEKSGAPVADLRPYLGAWGHTLILSEDATDYLHSHPTEMIPEDGDRAALQGGPDVVFDTFFPRPGNYRIWSQFLRDRRLITVSFTVHVPRLS
ncbi:MAG: heavy metal-binding domain-containing protein [Blastocatellia bacterium]